MAFTLKQFTNIDEIAREIGTLSKLHKAEAAGKVINLREAGKTSSVAKKPSSISKKLSDKTLSGITSLEQQLIHIKNIGNTLNTELKNEIDDVQLAKLNSSIKKIRNSIESKLELAISKNREITDSNINEDFSKMVSRVRKYLIKTLDGKIDKEVGLDFLSGANSEGQINVVGYITLHNLKNARNQIDPQVIIAITDRGNGNMLINPSLHKIEYPGKFNPGIVIKNEKDAIRVIENQLLVDSSLNIISPKPVPFTKAQLNLTHSKIAKATVGTNSVIVDLKDIADKAEAIEVTNDLYKEIYSIVLRLDPKSTSKIVYTTGKKGRGWRSVFSFISANRGKQISRNLKSQEISKLREIFSEEDISKIRRALNEG